MTGIFAVLARPGSWRTRAFALCMAAFACLAAASPASAQTAGRPTVAAPATATVLTPLSFINTRDMDFGRIATGPTAGTVTINPATNLCSTTGTILRIGTCQAAEFSGRGVLNAVVRLRVEQNSITLTGPGATMLLDTFTVDGASTLQFLGSPGNPRYRILGPAGIFNFRVGGTLRVGGNQPPGVYTGTFSVRADYI